MYSSENFCSDCFKFIPSKGGQLKIKTGWERAFGAKLPNFWLVHIYNRTDPTYRPREMGRSKCLLHGRRPRL